MTDQEIAAQVRKAAAEFNAAMNEAEKAGLRVTWEVRDEYDCNYNFFTPDRLEVGDLVKVTTF